jgi:hypothetical protein
VYFERSPLTKMFGGAPPIIYVPTFPWKYIFFTKWEKKKEIKRKLFLCKERFQYSCILLRFGNTHVLTPLGGPP